MAFYTGSDMELKYIEVATLMETITLPEPPPFPTHLEITLEQVYYPRIEELYTDMRGKFSISILNPLNDNKETPQETTKGSTNVRNVTNNSSLNVSSYQVSNYVTLNIPKYILLNFLHKVPAGTKFVVAFVGGSTDYNNIKVIGVA